MHTRTDRNGERERPSGKRTLVTPSTGGHTAPMSPAALLRLQRIAGNRAVTHTVQRSTTEGDMEAETSQPQQANPPTTLANESPLRRLKDGPLLSPAELSAIDDAQTKEADQYLNAHDYTKWLKQSPRKRLLLASLAWEKYKDDAPESARQNHITPAFTLGRTLYIHSANKQDPKLSGIKRARDDQIRDAVVNTLNVPEQGDPQLTQASDILARIFLILQNGLKIYDVDQKKHVDYLEGDVARALAHGGRVNIRIPALKAGEDPRALSNWLGLTDDEGKDVANRRSVGTHHMKIGKNRGNTRGDFQEQGGSWTGAKNLGRYVVGKVRPKTSSRLYGIDLAADRGDGAGNVDFNSNAITADGGHGHLFVNYQPPTSDRDGALQVGVETTKPGGTSPVGYRHGILSTEATANPESSFYGHKQDKIGGGLLAGNQRLVELRDFTTNATGWLDFLRKVKADWETRLADAKDRQALYRELVGPRRGDFEPPSSS